MATTTTQTFADNANAYPVIADVPCAQVKIRENNVIPTQNFDVWEPDAINGKIRHCGQGEEYVFQSQPGLKYTAGQTVGYLQLGTNSSTQFAKVQQ